MNIPPVDSILLVRIAITLTFLILAAGGPYALMKLRWFILVYTARHVALELRVAALERQLQEMRRTSARNEDDHHARGEKNTGQAHHSA